MKKDAQTSKPERDKSYYRLHTGAVEDLVGATVENTPKYSREELEKYRSGRAGMRLPEWLKVVLIKAWFYGAVCFFVFWGMGLYLADQLDLYFVAGVVMGMVTDLLINHFLRFTEKLPGGSRRYIMVTRRGALGFFLNLLYAFLLLFLVVTLYSVINMLLLVLSGGGEGALFLGVEPILFGLFTTGADLLCISFRDMFFRIAADARRS